ncbi:MAG TPA: protein kinase [Terriglobales bacterium]|nr:protein kinase [Terriglobales bacterium]
MNLQTLGRYRILEQIGAGGMGVVYRAHDDRLDRDVALKVLPPGMLADESSRRRFRNEALTLSRLSHPNIATVFDFDSDAGVDFLVTELIPGITLDAQLEAGPLREKQLLELGGQLMEGLAAAHAEGVIHRDLKPGNLRVTPDGRLKILDFGLARLLQPSPASATESMTSAGGIAGTLPYMAPEQLRGEPADERSDLWAAGAVLYELATGKRAFPQVSTPMLTDAILRQPPVPPRALNGNLPPEMEHIIGKALEKDPDHRYQSAREMAVDLRRLSAGRSSFAALQAPARPRRGRALLWAASALLLALAALGTYAWTRKGSPPPGTAARIESLAVLPLANLSGDPQQEYFADGMTEEMTSRLAQISALRVISRTSVMQYKGTRKPLPEIARELNVDAVVEGSVLRSGDRVRITAQLIDARNDRHLWSQSYERDLKDVLALQNDVARAVAGKVRVVLTPEEDSRLNAAAGVKPEAYELYLRARSTYRMPPNPEWRVGTQLAERAVALDPQFAQGQAFLASCYAGNGFIGVNEREMDAKAEAAVERAIALDPDLPDAYIAESIRLWTRLHGFPHEAAARAVHHGLKLNPNSSQGHSILGQLYNHVGLFDEAERELEKALSLDPNNAGAYYRIPRNLLYQQRFEAAVKAFRNPPPATATRTDMRLQENYQLGIALLALGRKDEALALVRKHIDQDPQGDYASVYAVVAAADHDRKTALEQIRIAIQRGGESSHFHHAAYHIAMAYALLGEKKLAVDWIRKTADLGMPAYPLFRNDPNFKPLQGDPAYEKLMAELQAQNARFKLTL